MLTGLLACKKQESQTQQARVVGNIAQGQREPMGKDFISPGASGQGTGGAGLGPEGEWERVK
jgi:hypothetical protein